MRVLIFKFWDLNRVQSIPLLYQFAISRSHFGALSFWALPFFFWDFLSPIRVSWPVKFIIYLGTLVPLLGSYCSAPSYGPLGRPLVSIYSLGIPLGSSCGIFSCYIDGRPLCSSWAFNAFLGRVKSILGSSLVLLHRSCLLGFSRSHISVLLGPYLL